MSKALKTVPFATLREELATILNLLVYTDQGFVVTRRGAPCAVLLPVDVLEKLGLSVGDLLEYVGK